MQKQRLLLHFLAFLLLLLRFDDKMMCFSHNDLCLLGNGIPRLSLMEVNTSLKLKVGDEQLYLNNGVCHVLKMIVFGEKRKDIDLYL